MHNGIHFHNRIHPHTSVHSRTSVHSHLYSLAFNHIRQFKFSCSSQLTLNHTPPFSINLTLQALSRLSKTMPLMIGSPTLTWLRCNPSNAIEKSCVIETEGVIIIDDALGFSWLEYIMLLCFSSSSFPSTSLTLMRYYEVNYSCYDRRSHCCLQCPDFDNQVSATRTIS